MWLVGGDASLRMGLEVSKACTIPSLLFPGALRLSLPPLLVPPLLGHSTLMVFIWFSFSWISPEGGSRKLVLKDVINAWKNCSGKQVYWLISDCQ